MPSNLFLALNLELSGESIHLVFKLLVRGDLGHFFLTVFI